MEIEANFTKINSIKSIYILEKVFSLLDKKIELLLLNHNKKIQNKLKINIESFKKLSQRYRIIIDKRICREFLKNTNYLIFEGEFKDGKKHGKGEEYYYNIDLALDEEYLNWQKREKNKNNYFKGNLKFRGEYFEGKIINGEGYDIYGNFVLKIKNEKGGEYYNNNNLRFAGEYKNGKRWNGKGYDYYGDEVFEIENGKGKGKIFNYDGFLIFEGDYLNGVRNGKGKEYGVGGQILFEGEYYFGKKIKGKKYDIKRNKILTFENSKGKEISIPNKNLIFEGEYLEDIRCGKGKEYNLNGCLIFEGEYLNGLKNGNGKEYNDEGKLIFEGEYLNGKRWNGIIREYNLRDNSLKFEGKIIKGELFEN